jgi:hypothetical protein
VRSIAAAYSSPTRRVAWGWFRRSPSKAHEEWVDENRYLNMDLLREHLKRSTQTKTA